MDGYRRRQLAYKIQKLCSLFFCVICLVLGFAQLSIAETDANTPVYCHQGECLYCDDNGCIVTSDHSSQQYATTSDEAISSADMNQLVSDLMAQERQTAPVHEPSTTPDSMSMDAFVSQINAGQQPPVAPPSKKPPKRTHRPAVQPKRAKSKTTVQPLIFYYQPTVDVAQYALHQGNSRSANLIETFIPIGRWSFEKVLFLDARFYNPNGTPVEGNIDLGFRRLFNQGNKLFGIYAGYDRYRSSTRRYYNQANAGFECWNNRFFFGGNVYIPFGTTSYDDDALNIAYLVPTNVGPYRYNIVFERGKERAMPGGDAEIGYDLTRHLTLYGGGYYFDHSEVKSILGPKLRATYTFYRSSTYRIFRLFDRIRLEGLISHDSQRGTSWMAGLRFSFGLSQHSTNPTVGVARHMMDPIRRDLNVVSEEYNEPFDYYMIDNHRARVDLVDGNTRMIEDAVDGNADVIGIKGAQTTDGNLTLTGDRDVTITGDNFTFTINGHRYTINALGKDGVLTTNNGFGSSIIVVADTTGEGNFTIEQLGFVGQNDDVGFALEVGATQPSFGKITVDRTTSNIPFSFASDSGAAGIVNFTHNTINIIDANPTLPTGAEFGAVIFMTDNSAQQLLVNQFSNNKITIANRMVGDDVAGLYSSGDSTTPTIVFSNGLSHNKINVFNPDGDGYGWNSSGNVIILGDMQGNTFIGISDTTFFGDDGYGWRSFGDVSISGDMHGNTFTGTTTASYSFGIGWLSDGAVTISGDMQSNTFTGTGTAIEGTPGYGWRSFGDVSISGDMQGNTFTGTAITSSSGYGWNSVGAVTISGDMQGNMFTGTGGTGSTSDGYGWRSFGDVTISGDMQDNTFTASNNDSDAYGWSMSSNVTISGFVQNNRFTVSAPSTAFGLYVDINSGEIVYFQNAVTGNRFAISDDNTSAHYGFNLDTGTGGDIYFQGNSDFDELRASNNNASVNPDAEFNSNIHFDTGP